MTDTGLDTVTYTAPCDRCGNPDAKWSTIDVVYYPPAGATQWTPQPRVEHCANCPDTP